MTISLDKSSWVWYYINIMKKKENLMTKINYLAARNGGINMYSDDGLKGWAKTAEGVAYTLKTVGIADQVMGSSSMDFAAEDGFKTNDGAMLLFKRALELI